MGKILRRFNVVTLLVCALFSGALQARVLLVVDQAYLSSSGGNTRIAALNAAITAKDKLFCTTVPFKRDYQKTLVSECSRLFDTLKTYYSNNYETSDKRDAVEGAVLIGDLPVAIFVYHGVEIPVEYLFMDLWDSKTKKAWGSCLSVWSVDGKNDRFTRNPYNQYRGDSIAEIWVSRIYAKTLNHIQDTGNVKYGQFLEEYEIIDRYLDRALAYYSQDQRSTIPARALQYGMASGFEWYGFSAYGDMNLLNLSKGVKSIINMNPLAHNVSAAGWQAQLQHGPYGNVNCGAFNGVQISDPNTRRDCRFPENTIMVNGKAEPDTFGYEWAIVFEHSSPKGHAFGYANSRTKFGYFLNNTYANIPALIDSGGFDPEHPDKEGQGSYYLADASTMWDSAFAKEPNFLQWFSSLYGITEFWFVAPMSGYYLPEMYYAASRDFSNRGYVNFFINGSQYQYYDDYVDQTRHHDTKDNWEPIGRYQKIFLYESDTLIIRFTPFMAYYSDRARKYAMIDAIRLSIGDTVFYCDNSMPLLDNDPSKGSFKILQWDARSFTSMINDGYRYNKPLFYIGLACQIAAYNNIDNVGILYAMAGNGLIMLGNSYNNSDSYNAFIRSIRKSSRSGSLINSFGMAYLNYVNNHRLFTWEDSNHILFGLGTLKYYR